MTNTTATAATETRVRIGRGVHVHRGNLDGNTYCGSQRRRGTRSGTAFLPIDTPVTCTKCVADAPAATPAPAPTGTAFCTNHTYKVQLEADGTCFMCE